jgi:hypothetical protein
MDFLATVLAQPEPGQYCFDKSDNKFRQFSYVTATQSGVALPQCSTPQTCDGTQACADLVIPLGTGRLYETDYDRDTGYYFYERLRHVGSFYDKIAAMGVLTDPSTYFIGVDSSQPVHNYLLSMGIYFSKELNRLFGGFAAGRDDVVGWVRRADGKIGPPVKLPIGSGSAGSTGWVRYLTLVTAMVGFWSTLALNIPDFTRYAKSQKDQLAGQAIGLPTTMTFYSFVGVAVTCATLLAFPDILLVQQAPWDPIALTARFNSPIVVIVSMVMLLVATLTTNIAANVVAPANGFANLFPKRISLRTGGIITALIGIAIMPWKLYADPDRYINGWLIPYGALLGPIAGIMIADYFVVRRTKLDLAALYQPTGVRLGTLAILAVAVAPNVPGFLSAAGLAEVSDTWTLLFKFAWFVGFGIAFVLYSVAGMIWKPTRTT